MDRQVTLPTRRGPEPSNEIMTACEVLTWIAFGEAGTVLPADRIGLETWGTTELAAVAMALGARTASAPYCPLEVPLEERNFLFGRSGPKTLRAIRARSRQREQKLVSFVDLLVELRNQCEANQRDCKFFDAASEELLRALRSEQITAYGRTSEVSEHQPIPMTFFMDRSASINWWKNTIGVDPPRRGRCFLDIEFKTSKVLALWPAEPETSPVAADGGGKHQDIIQALPCSAELDIEAGGGPKRQLTEEGYLTFARQFKAEHKKTPSRRDADVWSIGNGFTTTSARRLHKEITGRRRGRPQKRKENARE
jgi:hypothetical protein